MTAAIAASALPNIDFAAPITKAPKSLRILILGGTGFIGPHQVRYAVERGHKLTLFNRGKTNPGLFPNVEHIEGDRAVSKLDALKTGEWDAVIDNPSTLPRWVREAAEILKGRAGQYVFISTISVYADNSKIGMDETAAVATTDDPASEKIGANYGALKALSEKEAERIFPGRTTVIRPGLIVGPGDQTDRFTYWPVRVHRGGEVLAPGDGSDPVQIIDARDLGEWSIRMVEQQAFGTYNALGPKQTLTMKQMLTTIQSALKAEARFTWVEWEFLKKNNVRPWSDMPVWIPSKEPEMAGFSRVSNVRALAKGLTFRPLADTARATLEDYQKRPAEKAKLNNGLSAEREAEVLKAWHESQKASR